MVAAIDLVAQRWRQVSNKITSITQVFRVDQPAINILDIALRYFPKSLNNLIRRIFIIIIPTRPLKLDNDDPSPWQIVQFGNTNWGIIEKRKNIWLFT